MRLALVDERISDKCRTALLRRGFNVIPMPAAEGLSTPVASHPDMLIARLGNDIITTADYIDRAAYVFSDIREYAPHVRIHVTDERYSTKYPDDAILNVLALGKKLFLKKNSVSKTLLSIAESLGYEIINTNQGYPACTVLQLTDSDAITADRGLALTLMEWGASVTIIKNGGITLPPYEYGFIGGASGVFDKTVYFLGDVMKLPDGEKIVKKIESCGMMAVSLSDEIPADLGKIIFL